MKKFRSIFVLIFIVVALFSSGCTEKNLNAEQIASQMMDKENNTRDYSYTMHMNSYFGGENKETESKTMFKKPNMIKSIVTEPGKENQTIIVSDGKTLWSYTPDTNTVTKIKISKASELTKNDYTNIIDNFLNDTNVTVLGVENVDGRKTYLLETTPKENDGDYELIYKTKIWVDQETWMPLRYETYNGDGNLTMKLEIRDLKVNTGIPDSEFKFEVPTGAKIVDLGEIKPPEELSLEEARKKASFKILTPKYLPEGYEFNNSMIYNNSIYSSESQISETVELTYTKDKAIIDLAETVSKNQSSDAAVMDKSEDIKINGIEGKYVSMGKMKLLTWKLGDVNLSLCASLEKDEMLKIAESISEKT
ncbi:outer membrane lipoprotein-sorting protein [Methanosarcina sp. Z-7115]|uniref:Outer membrane lipoprotein-sorting protein n=1 Tax=Methanosarcina baikalica TaxID=3073890 RepID=A0ABU2D5U9_9EURY|nr:outer membrane lipoprotein-sorting protein [Methanosarcina sp. Z-7115]MDR7667330.1 outer membrane lipoprotein-sorting protein [Methanosarcina sp. Z-7115]